MWQRAGAIAAAIVTMLTTGTGYADGMLSDFPYPHPVRQYAFTSQGQPLFMAYMDIQPTAPANGRAVVLFHGKNFCGATWESTITPLAAAGYRVIVPDQIGFCLEDWSAKGVPALTIDELIAGERKTDSARIKTYQQRTYYDGRWRPDFDRWVEMLASTYRGEGSELAILSQARASDMVFSQPVVHEFPRLIPPVVLIIGERDTTAIGKDRAPPEVAAKLGRYAELAHEAERRIPNARLITFPTLGHSPQVEEPEKFNATLLEALAGVASP